MSARLLPIGARKIARYFYDGGVELEVYAFRRNFYVINPNTCNWPFDPCYGKPHPYPSVSDDVSYETLGLYYGYAMPETGWDGDC